MKMATTEKTKKNELDLRDVCEKIAERTKLKAKKIIPIFESLSDLIGGYRVIGNRGTFAVTAPVTVTIDQGSLLGKGKDPSQIQLIPEKVFDQLSTRGKLKSDEVEEIFKQLGHVIGGYRVFGNRGQFAVMGTKVQITVSEPQVRTGDRH